MSDGDLVVSEVFGPTFQGEGPSLGRRCGFVRLGRCNLTCGGPGPASWACDTPYTWDWKGQNGRAYDPAVELHRRTVDDVVGEVAALDVDRVVVTGGEPMLQRRGLAALATACSAAGLVVEIETNGTITPDADLVPHVSQFNVSPKLASSGVDEALRRVPAAIEGLRDTGRAVWKFVATEPADLDEAERDFVRPFGLQPVYVMPGGTSAGAITAVSQALADDVLARGWHLTTRLHVLLWGDERGR